MADSAKTGFIAQVGHRGIAMAIGMENGPAAAASGRVNSDDRDAFAALLRGERAAGEDG